jgi:FlaA1/EpsC-like NDP-sugar epimerase
MDKLTKAQENDLFGQKTVLITGGTGSFGNFIMKRLLKTDVARVLIFSRDEEKQLEMKRKYEDSRIEYIIGNVRDYDAVYEAVKDADIVYHAAAMKIISTCEEYPRESIKTNLEGTINVRDACFEAEVEKAVFISTDKAVKPVNTYGICKALAEKLWIEFLGPETDFIIVRYGNVINSRGSVIPFFKKLVRYKKTLPVTDERMTRFLITLEQAIDMVFYATKCGINGRTFVPRGIPACRIADLVEALGGEGYPYEVVGIRPGEKIHEVLVSEEEIMRLEKMGGYWVILPYDEPYRSGLSGQEFTSENATRLSVEEIKELIG